VEGRKVVKSLFVVVEWVEVGSLFVVGIEVGIVVLALVRN
jgi:hypothetical protein